MKGHFRLMGEKTQCHNAASYTQVHLGSMLFPLGFFFFVEFDAVTKFCGRVNC